MYFLYFIYLCCVACADDDVVVKLSQYARFTFVGLLLQDTSNMPFI
jgi:hypothetical protein